ncbi:hypothetical protein BDY21DRAFT_326859 [Lineolata rhizophorae]|uniref:Fungal-type protein kinase domain-containing protein n=1 Tax=Lineolata rhizophorae TaxID=578093 RepID=A0A6A6NQ19_9PEZI|nr:hypothetical protein BDY21DRAFT_326859 [Lineolata rhizophorae]
MADPSREEIIRNNPIGKGLDAFRNSLDSVCSDLGVPSSVSVLDQICNDDLQKLALRLVLALQNHPASLLLPSITRRGTLFGDLAKYNLAIDSHDADIERIIPLLKAVLSKESDEVIWDRVYAAVTEPTPPPQALPFLDQTRRVRNMSSLANSSEYRKDTDSVLKEELRPLYAGVPYFYETFFGGVPGLDVAAAGVFAKCKEGNDPLYSEDGGWCSWPERAGEADVLDWFSALVERFLRFAECDLTDRRLVQLPRQNVDGSKAKRTLDIGFGRPDTEGAKTHWTQILVPGELKSNPSDDKPSAAWQDVGRYAREVFAAQDTRRFVLGFTLCGSIMRLWEFDRVGGIGSSPFDINKEGLKFVSVVLGYLWIDEQQLGFDPTILESNGERFVQIKRYGRIERLIIDERIKRSPCVAGRATTCWKAHREGDESPLVIKDSWQYPEREEEGDLLREATERGVVNVAQYYYHETVYVDGRVDDTRDNIRKGLDVTMADNYKQDSSIPPSNTALSRSSTKKERSTSTAEKKRSSSSTNLPPPKRPCFSSPTKAQPIPNRVHRRVIVSDYGKLIYKASSRVALLAALEACIEGHQSLVNRVGLLQCDISPNNLIVDEGDGNRPLRAFLIDLDLAIKEQREGCSGALGKTGTRAFMAIGVLLDEKHSFMHDLESFFWVLFWICIHYDGPGKEIGPTEFESWNYESDRKLATLKSGTIHDEGDFLRTLEENFTPYYKPLIPHVNHLRRKIFPGGRRWRKEDLKLYADVKDILREAQRDTKVSGIGAARGAKCG